MRAKRNILIPMTAARANLGPAREGKLIMSLRDQGYSVVMTAVLVRWLCGVWRMCAAHMV